VLAKLKLFPSALVHGAGCWQGCATCAAVAVLLNDGVDAVKPDRITVRPSPVSLPASLFMQMAVASASGSFYQLGELGWF